MNKLFFIVCSILSITIFAQGNRTPEKITQEAKIGKATMLKDNNAGGFYAETVSDTSTLLFEYNYTSSQQDEIADDELKEIISFNIVPNRTGKFLISGKELVNAQANYYKGCFCMDRGSHTIVSGTIRGAKMSKTTWYVNIQVMVSLKIGENYQLIPKKVKGIFTIVN